MKWNLLPRPLLLGRRQNSSEIDCGGLYHSAGDRDGLRGLESKPEPKLLLLGQKTSISMVALGRHARQYKLRLSWCLS